MDRKQYDELLKKGFKSSEAIKILEAKEQRPRNTESIREEELEEERAFREAKEGISRKYNKGKQIIREIKAGIPKVASRESLSKTGRFVAGAMLLAPGDIKANLQRNKAIKTGARKAYIRSRKEELSLRKQEIDIRRQELAIEKARMQPQRPVFVRRVMKPAPMQMMTNDDMGMSEAFNTGSDLMGNLGKKKKKSGSSDPFGLSGYWG